MVRQSSLAWASASARVLEVRWVAMVLEATMMRAVWASRRPAVEPVVAWRRQQPCLSALVAAPEGSCLAAAAAAAAAAALSVAAPALLVYSRQTRAARPLF